MSEISGIRLYSYWRSSASWRVRIALAFKGLRYEIVPINLIRGDGEQHSAEHTERNPMRTIPYLEIVDPRGQVLFGLGESLAILHYLEDLVPHPPLLTGGPENRAQQRWLAELINAGIHPLQNRRVLLALGEHFGADEAARQSWARTFITRGFAALEAILPRMQGQFCVGNSLSIADVCLLPQVYNAERHGVCVSDFPRLHALASALRQHPAFAISAPELQPDAPAPAAN